ncbi:MAG: PfkB family carbohydrate kinase [Candidatus Izemoplasmatales bacterium]|jgi:sugar/nucleoside kinase (ribokinase family)|nr:PfkB family carbohydrate kinase [Candidatus Izemoplasmatales bacterium]
MDEVFVLGGVSYDTIIQLDKLPDGFAKTIFAKNIYQVVGSTGAGKAIALKKLGFKVTLHGVIGDDNSGKIIENTLRNHNVRFISDIDFLGTETHTNLMSEDGNRISIFTNSTSFEPTVNQYLIENQIKKADIIVLNIMNYCRKFIPLIKTLNKKIWVDIHDYDGQNSYYQDFIEAADYLFLSSDLLPNYKEFMSEQISLGKELVVCTHGKHGSSLLTKDKKWLYQDSIPGTRVVDTNGAGDNFFAGFLYAYTMGKSYEKCLYSGAQVAKKCVEHLEIVSPLLNTNWLDKLL